MAQRAQILFPAICRRPSEDLHFRVGKLKLVGMSTATVATAYAIDAFKVAVDMGRCTPLLANQETVLLTHCHSDHTAGLLAWLSARVRRHRGAPAKVVVPREKRNALLVALESWPDLDVVRRRVDLSRMLVPAKPGIEIELAGGGWARAFALHHTTTSLGWKIGEAGRSRPRIIVAGDSTILPFREDIGVLDADLAVVDCTFVEPGMRVAARLSGHAHLREWMELCADLPCDQLVLAHLPSDVRAERLAALLEPWPEKGPSVIPWVGRNS